MPTVISSPRYPTLRPAPKNREKNVAYRKRVLQAARVSDEFRHECIIRCKHDPVFWVDTFLWTFNSKQYPSCPHRLFILWEFQEDMFHRLRASIGKHDMLIEKSRDMGATWVCLAVLMHLWQFYEDQSALVGSYKQDLVDKIGDQSSLFSKMDYIIDCQPRWMVPALGDSDRKLLLLSNPSNDSVVAGESTNPNFGHATRPGVMFLDEFGRVADGHAILTGTRDATKTRWFNSTPQGAYGAFYDRRKKMIEANPDRVLRLHWSIHPFKRRGLYRINKTGNDYEILDHEYKFPEGFKFLDVDYPEFKLRSPWFNEQCERAGSPQEIAQQLDIEYHESAWQFISIPKCEELAAKHALPAEYVGELSYEIDGAKPSWQDVDNGHLQLWCQLNPGTLRPIIKNPCVIACDIAGGKGEKSSNSVAVVYDSVTKEKVAQLVTNELFPYEFAPYAVALCHFFATAAGPAYLNWEENGPGGQEFFDTVIRKIRFTNVFYMANEKTISREKTNKPGWHSSPAAKQALLRSYRAAILEGELVNRSAEAIMECAEFVEQPGGKIEHCKAISTQDPTAQGDGHGDVVIADALAWRTLADINAPKATEPENIMPSHECWAKRRAEWETTQRKKKSSW